MAEHHLAAVRRDLIDPYACHRRRRLPDGRPERRRRWRPYGAVAADRAVRRQRHLHRRQHRPAVSETRPHVSKPMAGRFWPSTAMTWTPCRRLSPKPARHQPPEPDMPHRHRLWRAEAGTAAPTARAQRRGDRGHPRRHRLVACAFRHSGRNHRCLARSRQPRTRRAAPGGRHGSRYGRFRRGDEGRFQRRHRQAVGAEAEPFRRAAEARTASPARRPSRPSCRHAVAGRRLRRPDRVEQHPCRRADYGVTMREAMSITVSASTAWRRR